MLTHLPPTPAVHIHRFIGEELSRLEDRVWFHHLTVLYAQAFNHPDVREVRAMLIRRFQHGERIHVASEHGTFTAIACWQPVDEARYGTAELTDVGWLPQHPNAELVQQLLEAVEENVRAWYRKKNASLQRMAMFVPAEHPRVVSALEHMGFRPEGSPIPRFFRNLEDGLFFTKHYPEPTPEVA